MIYPVGASVTVPGRGDGIIIDTVAGPYRYHYRVLLRTRDPETGWLTSVEVADPLPGPVLPVFEPGQRITYRGRPGVILAILDGLASLVMEPDPVEPGYPGRQYTFTLPVWKLHVENL